jgi:hypothetical protein
MQTVNRDNPPQSVISVLLQGGLVPVIIGLALFGVSGRSFDRWMRPDNGVDTSLLLEVKFVAPKTNKPRRKQSIPTIGPTLVPRSASPGSFLGLGEERPMCAADTRSATSEAATPASPILNANGNNPFGAIQEKGDQRRFFKGSVRFNF